MAIIETKPEDNLKKRIDRIEEQKRTLKNKLSELTNKGKKAKLTLNQRELAKDRAQKAKVYSIIGKTFLSSTKQINNIHLCINKIEDEKEKAFIDKHINSVLEDLRDDL
jgi:hypothetical protein